MILSAYFIVLALVLYTVTIWSERLGNQGLMWWMILVFVLAFLSDIVGTTIMMLRAKSEEINFHQICGYSALVIMFLHLVWAIFSVYSSGETEKLFHRYSIYAWIIWLTAFISGIPKR